MEFLSRLENQEVLIVGDVMIDRYLRGAVSRISPEAPVPVVLHRDTEDRLGGAANVALNVQALGGRPILCSVVGDDEDGNNLIQKILPGNDIETSGLLRSTTRRTTLKTRVLGNNQQMLRIDSEDTHDLSEQETDSLLKKVAELLDSRPVQVIILQDYNKGVLTERVIRAIVGEAKRREIFTAADPKKANFFAYEGVGLFKPNLKEVRESVPFPIATDEESLQKASDFLREKLGNPYTMLTLSEKGLFLDGGTGGKRYPTTPRNIADVSGAGDTVISIAAMALAAGLDLETVALLSNMAGGQVCESPGVVSVDRALLEKELTNSNLVVI
ncbi:MAG: bifunctional heptose 7-phosphate kinase/heptose 1-phosphate adenyltransferase [Saprospiraceae bacterium]